MPDQKLKKLQLVMEIGQTGVPFSIRGSIRFVRQDEVEDKSKHAAAAACREPKSRQADKHFKHRLLIACTGSVAFCSGTTISDSAIALRYRRSGQLMILSRG
jgi:hypothetical protein